jgi:hypothetical protein
MALNSKRAKATPKEIDDLIEAGGSIPNQQVSDPIKNEEAEDRKDVRFTVAMPAELAEVIDKLRKPTKTSRQAWLLQAAHEKLEREGRL